MANLQTLYGDNDDNQVQTRKQKKNSNKKQNNQKKKEGKKNKTTLEFPTFAILASQKSSN